MDCFDLLKKGDLAGATEQMTTLVRKQPGDADHRYHLAGLLAMRGELDRAETHLATIAKLEPQLAGATGIYLGLVQAEEERRRVYAGTAAATAPPDAREDIAPRQRLRRALAGDDAAAAGAAMAAIGRQTTGPGAIDGAAFAALGDADESLGSVLEVFAGGRYLWWPLAEIAALEFDAPRGLLDFLWLPCQLTGRDGRRARAHVPVAYAGSLGHADADVCRAHRTEWVDEHGVAFRGFGQRLFVADGVERPLLETRSVTFAAAEPAP